MCLQGRLLGRSKERDDRAAAKDKQEGERKMNGGSNGNGASVSTGPYLICASTARRTFPGSIGRPTGDQQRSRPSVSVPPDRPCCAYPLRPNTDALTAAEIDGRRSDVSIRGTKEGPPQQTGVFHRSLPILWAKKRARCSTRWACFRSLTSIPPFHSLPRGSCPASPSSPPLFPHHTPARLLMRGAPRRRLRSLRDAKTAGGIVKSINYAFGAVLRAIRPGPQIRLKIIAAVDRRKTKIRPIVVQKKLADDGSGRWPPTKNVIAHIFGSTMTA
uniref:Uncharacterized protein n=1 Tax=Plectus sambesii TaxID=2011161 RepID=A0A914XDN1_9BILA